ncbi:copper chaperone [Kaistia algarum]|uniref:heavy-metal-associated domain-containing protein n=1 Tax=Kaistia algarum TaxID=2083279 RepID=UPI000CE8A6C5|nr:heavy-metal-associated domain-containing protein [Kaistia algarum]MCX5515870.1 heavy-metal-associated domain-containing protein [Kaistia algarum]PPE80764.1 copper chaperone [Kaistia algarum]
MLVLKVPEMSCGHCVATIEKAVRSVDPSAQVAADIAAKFVQVETSFPEAAIRAAMSEVGYETVPA